MKYLIKPTIIFLAFFIIFQSNSFAANKILPLPKPLPTKEVKSEVEKKKEIYPQKKPTLKKKITEVDKETEVAAIKEDEFFIYPEKKPIIFKKKVDNAVKDSSILSKKDFKIAKETFKAVDKRKWLTALKLAKKAKDKNLYNLINYLYLKTSSNAASFNDYSTFISKNSNYPRINRLRYLAEHKINLRTNSPINILKWFGNTGPLSEFGKIKLGEIFLLRGEDERGAKLIKEGWIKARLSKNDLKYLRKKYKKIITVEDNVKRADWHAWEGKYWDLKRMLRYLPKDYTTLYNARQILMSQSYGVDTAIKKVDAKFKNDVGLKYDRLKWRRKRGRLDPSLEILFNIPKDPIELVRPEIWWKERSILTRSLIYKKKYALAYKVASNHYMNEGPEYAEAEWMSGWIALTFLDDPNLALQHFHSFYKNVGYPISLARGAYWLGRSYKKIRNKQKSEEWFNESSKYLNTYYGQLAFVEINPGQAFTLVDMPKVTDKYKKEFNKNPLVKIVRLLKELDKTKYSKDFIKHLSILNIENGSEILSAKLAIDVGRYDYAIQISKEASYQKRFYNVLNYPIIETPDLVNQKKMPKQELVLSVIRQESEFDDDANSSAGARGMMQLMTYTARLVSKQANLAYSKNKLTEDPKYNIKLGSYYLASLLEEYEGSYPFALAAYNAGPKRVRYWKKINGNPQKGKISYVDWVELIKFKETRNYVQRVLENVNVYRYILTGKPVKIYNFFEDKTHY
ncbi:lytic transglycosylase domain-containing protein [Pelagibacteraceae bacterium]|nr:lytic transglycosylase domain-containing protein [Pelagibacteraceae bacterium]